MLDIIISLLTFVLILISLFMVMVILMQRASTNSGMGSAFGGGVAESAFGTETTNVLVRATKWAALGFFIISLTLYLLFISRAKQEAEEAAAETLPDIPVAVAQEPAAEPTVETVAESVAGAVEEAAAEAQETVDGFTAEPVTSDTPPNP